MWLDANGHYFCCLPGQIGIDGEGCVAAYIPVPSSTLATSVSIVAALLSGKCIVRAKLMCGGIF
jgi:hypothetical protein